MKTRFNTYDIICMTTELQRLVGMRVNQVYDIDNRSYLIRLQRSEEKCVLLLESANRFHTTQFEWPKNVAPSGFTMKLRKHLKNKRLESLTQLGIDRVIDLQFGSGEAAYHIILELYDRGNIVLTDYEWTILNVLRPHVEGDKVRFAVKEKYPLDRAKTNCKAPNEEALREILTNCKQGDNLKKVLNPKLECGPAIIDHVLLENGLAGNLKVGKDKGFLVERDLGKLMEAMQQADQMMENARKQICKGYITQKKEERPNPEGQEKSYLLTNVEFHPMLYAQHREQPHTEYETFDRAVDEFFSALEGQKIDLKTIQVEREALKKLENVRRDHSKRLESLTHTQAHDRRAAELIARNEPLVEAARNAVQTALATQMSWDDIQTMLKEAQLSNDPIASRIMQLKLNTNRISLMLNDPYAESDYDGDEEQEKLEPMLVDIDLSLTAYANARSYYDQKRNAAKKQQKTIESADKALKSAERKTKQTLKEAQTISNISKARKTYWFEKFFWFISSDNYLVIGGRDQQQNELLVKRYMRPKDVYVHADVSGAASILIKNPSGAPVPPRTLSEAGQAAVAYSVAWEAKVLTSAWWVHAHQVSKSAPTGEFLTTGSFMIRGKKNYLLPQHLQLGFSFLFRLEESCVERHRDERKVIGAEESASDATSLADDQEIVVSDDEEPSEKDDTKPKDKLDTIREEITNIVIEAAKEDLQEDNVECGKDEEDKIEDDEQDKEDDGKEIQSDSESDSEAGFPDTHIKVDHGTGQVVLQSRNRTMSEVSDRSEDTVSMASMPKKGGKKPQKESKQQKKEVKPKEGLKRGQRSKLKKIMEKYKDQDDEDREYMTNLLHAGNQSKKSKKAAKKEANKASGKSKGSNRGPKIPAPAPLILEAESDGETQEIEVDQQTADVDTEMLWQLTGSPFPDDELLFAVPVVAPYSALNNYKFKVKLTPGTSKRGKAAKTAVQVFLKDRSCTPREKDLLKAVKEENFARNFPGKVKLSAPQLQKKLYNR